MTRRLSFLCIALPMFASAVWGQVEPARTPITWVKPVQEKNFYLLSLIERDASVKKAFLADPTLRRLGDAKREALAKATTSCEVTTACYIGALRFTDDEIAEADRAIAALFAANADLRKLVEGPMRASGMFVRYHALPAKEMLSHAWMDAVKGVNYVMDVYGSGKPPRYPAIDSIVYDPTAQNYARIVHGIESAMADDMKSLDLFFTASLQFALHLMDANDRDEAGRFEPLHLGENAAAVRHIPAIDWSRYQYTVIVVPGEGNDRPGVALSPGGRIRNMLAARRYHDGLAPLIIVSGGYVHPNQTPYNEAFEMKRSLMQDFGVPAEAILIEPHARHTTTNIRNAVRLMYRHGIPMDRPGLITTDLYQSRSIESPAFAQRCDRELGYQPHKLLRRTSPSDLEFLPLIEALHGDVIEPLDP
jgi:hypothetical protein